MPDQTPTQLSSAVVKPQAGDDFTHFCGTHHFDCECVADPKTCRAYCGYEFPSDEFDAVDEPECVVCAEMLDAADDPECFCDVCEEIADA